MTHPDMQRKLVKDIDAYINECCDFELPTPDFWSELETTENLADFLFRLGWKKEI